MDSKKEILVLGAGVSGLSTGILLLKNGYKVKIWAKDLPPNTTSNKAAALWYPYLCFPKDKAIPWARFTFDYLQKEIMQDSESGCIKRIVSEIFDKPQEKPWWESAYPGKVERPSKEELPKGYVDGYRIETIVFDTSIYMDYLVKMFRNLGGTIIQKEIKNIEETFEEYNLVVNCTGLGSRELFNDNQIYPVRGQMVKIKPTTFDEIVVSDDHSETFSLVVPRINDTMIGGTAQKDNWNTEIDPEDTKEILRKIFLIAPRLKDIEVIGESIGLRPARDSVRLEPQNFGDKIVVHNYGHGGAGFTLSWGCAKDVVEIIENL